MRKTILLLAVALCAAAFIAPPAGSATQGCSALPEVNIPYLRFTSPNSVWASLIINCTQYMNVRYEICLQEQSPFTFAWKTVRCRGTGTNGVYAYRSLKSYYITNAVNCASGTVRKWRVYAHGDVYYQNQTWPFVGNGGVHSYYPHSGGKSLACLV